MWKEKAVDQLSKRLPDKEKELLRLIDAASMFAGSGSVFRRIARAKENEAVFDYVAEIRFGLTFAGLEFELQFEPCGEKGPDLLVSRDGQSAYVEVKRIRPSSVEPTLPCLDLSDESSVLVQYGERSVQKLEDDLSDKFRQVGESTSIIACWSDRFSVEEVDFESAIRHLRVDSQAGARQIPAGLLFCIFGSNWFTSRGQGLCCGVLKDLVYPFASWASDLEGTRWSLENLPNSVGALELQEQLP